MKISNELTVVGFESEKARERFILEAAEYSPSGEVIHFNFGDLLQRTPGEQDDRVYIESRYQSGPKRFQFEAYEEWKGDDQPRGRYEELSVSYHFHTYPRPAIPECRLLSKMYPDVMIILYISPGEVQEYSLSVFRDGKSLYGQSIKYAGLTDPFYMMHFNPEGLPWWKREDIHAALLHLTDKEAE